MKSIQVELNDNLHKNKHASYWSDILSSKMQKKQKKTRVFVPLISLFVFHAQRTRDAKNLAIFAWLKDYGALLSIIALTGPASSKNSTKQKNSPNEVKRKCSTAAVVQSSLAQF